MTRAMLTVACAMVALSTAAGAQLPTTRILTLEAARAIAEGALIRCRAEGVKAAIIVVDALNAPKILLRDDGASAANGEVARMKATTTLLYDRPSGPRVPPPPGTSPIGAIPGTYNSAGAVPIQIDGVTIGAVSVSASPPGQEKDVACANAGIAYAAGKLR